MAGERTLPGLGLTGYWNAGDNSWKPGMDVNLLKLSTIVNGVVLSRATSLPGSPVQGEVYIVPAADANGNDLAIYDNGAWTYVTPNVGWLLYVVDETKHYRFEAAGWVEFAPAIGGGGGGGGGAGPLVSGAAEWQDMPITNGDFETGDLTGWTTVGSAPVLAATPWGGVTEANNGSWVATGGALALAQVYQDVVLGAADDSAVLFQVSADLLKDYADSDVSSVKVQILDGSDSVLAENSMTVTSGSPVKESRSVQVPSMAGQAKLRVTLIFDRNTGTNNNCGLDNISVRRYVLSQYAVPVDSAPYARSTPIDNASTWNLSGPAIAAPVELVQDDGKGVIGMTCTGATGTGQARRIENPAKRPTAGADFDHVLLLDMVTSASSPWSAGVHVENSATGKLVAFGIMANGEFYRWRWTGTTFDNEAAIDGAMAVSDGSWPIKYYTRLKRVGATLEIYLSGDGLGWVKVHEETIADHLGDIDRVGLFFNPQAQGAADTSSVFLLGHDDTGAQPRATNGGSRIDRKATTGASYTVTDSDLLGNVVNKLDFPASGTVTVPAGLTGREPCTFLWTGVGQPVFSAAVGVTLNSAGGDLKIAARYASVTLIPDGADNFILVGNLTA